MLAHFRRLSGQAMVYGLGDAAARIAALILLPIYTHILTPSDYGKLSIVGLIPTVLTLVLEAGQRTAFFRFYYQVDESQARRRLTGTVTIYLLTSAVAILTPVFLLLNHIALPLFEDVTLIPLIRIALFGIMFDLGSVIPFAIFRAEQRAAQYARLSLFRFLINASLNIIAVTILRWGVIGVIYANLFTSVLFFIICFSLTLRAMEWIIDWNLLKQLLRFGLPLIPVNLAGWMLTFSDRFFLQKYGDLNQVGVYAVAYSVAGILFMLMGWFNIAWVPYSFSVAKQQDARIFYARILTYVIASFTFVGLGLSLFAPEVLYFFTVPSYYEGAVVVPLIVVSYLFYEVYYVISLGFDLTGKTPQMAFITAAGAVFNLFLNYVLIPQFGMKGAAVATVLSYLLLPVIEYPIVQKIYPVSYEWGRLLKLALISVSVYYVGVVLRTKNVWINIGVDSAFVLVWCLALYCFNFFTINEVFAMQSTLNKGLQISLEYIRRVVSQKL
jgi:O-antigen/teichoic acid export membrane protein